jgi:KUP system potassium uptake protein
MLGEDLAISACANGESDGHAFPGLDSKPARAHRPACRSGSNLDARLGDDIPHHSPDASSRSDDGTPRISLAVFATTAIAATRVVFGDIGTSPLYTFAGIYAELKTDPKPEDLIGTFSCIFWALTLVVSIKYVGCVMRVNHHGEGGTFALLQCIFAGHKDGQTPPLSTRSRYGIRLLAMLGCSLLIGDGAITPAMSVLGALEGLIIMVDITIEVRVVVTVIILLGLFAIQRQGSKLIGLVAGPVMVIWFATLAALGVNLLYDHPEAARAVSQGFSPWAAIQYFASGEFKGRAAWKSLGGIVLCVTGAEALFADMGHFGAMPITATWLVLVYPALIVNYLGQTALLYDDPTTISNPFFYGTPVHLRWPVLVIATLAAIIASQALISGVFSLLSQAHTLNFCPRILVLHTNEEERGQVYIPEVNAALCALCLILVVSFKDTTHLASAYGVAVTGDANITTILLALVLRRVYRWPLIFVLLILTLMLVVDLSFLTSNIIKVKEAGWVPLVIASVCCILMHTYHWGRTREEQKAFDGVRTIQRRRLSLSPAPSTEQSPTRGPNSVRISNAKFRRYASPSTGCATTHQQLEPQPSMLDIASLSGLSWGRGAFAKLQTTKFNDKQLLTLLRNPEFGVTRTNACTVFMSPRKGQIPQSLLSLAHSFGCVPRTLVLLTIAFDETTPFVEKGDRATFDPIDVALGVYRIVLHFGYAEPLTAVQNMRHALGKVARMHVREYPSLRPLAILSKGDFSWDASFRDRSRNKMSVGRPESGNAIRADPLFEMATLEAAALEAAAGAPEADAGNGLRLRALSKAGIPQPQHSIGRSSLDGEPLTSRQADQYDSSVTFVVNRLNYVARPGHSIFSLLRIALYKVLVHNARKPISFFGLPADCTVEVSSVKYI